MLFLAFIEQTSLQFNVIYSHNLSKANEKKVDNVTEDFGFK